MATLHAAHLNEEGIERRVQELLGEVNALAVQLRKPAALAEGKDSVPAGARGILQVLGDIGPLTVPGIARERGHSRQSVQILVNRLARLGWVELTSNPAHKRSAMIRLTARGEVVLTEAAQREAANLDSRLGGISESGARRASALLRQIRRALAGKELAQEELVRRRNNRKRVAAVAHATRDGAERLGTNEAQAAETRESGSSVHRREDHLEAAEDAAVPEPSQPEPEEFPVNLL